MSSTIAASRATLADLALADGKAELVGGVVVPIMPTGYRPSILAGRIFRRLANATSQEVALAAKRAE